MDKDINPIRAINSNELLQEVLISIVVVGILFASPYYEIRHGGSGTEPLFPFTTAILFAFCVFFVFAINRTILKKKPVRD